MNGLGVPSDMSSHSKKSDDHRSFSAKRCRLSSDDSDEKEVASLAIGSSMVVDLPNPQAKEVSKVSLLSMPLQDMLMVIHDDTSASSLNKLTKPLPQSTGIF